MLNPSCSGDKGMKPAETAVLFPAATTSNIRAEVAFRVLVGQNSPFRMELTLGT